MTKRIQYQRDLMEKAITKLTSMELLKINLKNSDPLILKILIEELQIEYADIMAELFEDMDRIKNDSEYPTLYRQFDFSKN